MKTDPHEARLLLVEASPVVGNLAVAIYVGGFGGPVLGTFGSMAEAQRFAAEVNRVVVAFGGEPVAVEVE